MSTALENAYRGVVRQVFRRILLPRLASSERRQTGESQWAEFVKRGPLPRAPHRRVWWHAASVGELENLWPVILKAAREGGEFVVTVLSESAGGHLAKRIGELESLGVAPIFSGYAPWEGDWSKAISMVSPTLFVTSKYEAWPELWMTLAKKRIPLAIVGAKARKSLKLCAGVCRALGADLPEMKLLTADESEVSELRSLFPKKTLNAIEVIAGGDPRWDQVAARARVGNERARVLARALEGKLKRPWGVLGSVWLKDLELWKEAGFHDRSIIAAPHRVDAEHLKEMERFLKGSGVSFLKTSLYPTSAGLEKAISEFPGISFVWVDEMGFLSELYAAADWAYVGGGFGAGVHSRIEPAIHGIPVSCGPARADEFTETHQLKSSGQLDVVSNARDLGAWLRNNAALKTGERERWKSEALKRTSASDRIVKLLWV